MNTDTDPEDSQFEGMLADLKKVWAKSPIDFDAWRMVVERAGFVYPLQGEDEDDD